VLNIAEGAGKVRQADKQRYFAIARGSVMECGGASLTYFKCYTTSLRMNTVLARNC
jgi:four helix bundle protein